MAFNNTMLKDGSRLAGADLSSSQFLGVKLNSSSKVVAVSGATDYSYGVLLNAPTSGQAAEVCIFGLTKAKAGGTVAAADQVMFANTGKVVTCVPGTDTTKYKIGTAVTGGASGEIITIAFGGSAMGRAA